MVVGEWSFNIPRSPYFPRHKLHSLHFTPLRDPGDRGSRYRIADWAEAVLVSEGRPLVVVGEYGKGRVIWSGMNLFYHVKSYRDSEESRFINKILRWLTDFNVSSPDYKAEFVNPQRRIVEIDDFARGILFKENYFKQWHALIRENGECYISMHFIGVELEKA